MAAGKGTRMNSEKAKVLIPLKGKPVISCLLESIEKSGVDPRPVVIVGYQAEEVKKVLGDRYEYALQEEQLGTGHAVSCAQDAVGKGVNNVIVLNGDVPLVKPETIKKLKESHDSSNSPITIMTIEVEDYDGWRESFYGFGRIVRDSSGKIDAIIEKKDASEKQLEIKEVNPALYCFNNDWLWENLSRIKNENAVHEYYVTDLVHIAIEEGYAINSLPADPLECVGINTPEDFKLAERLISDNPNS